MGHSTLYQSPSTPAPTFSHQINCFKSHAASSLARRRLQFQQATGRCRPCRLEHLPCSGISWSTRIDGLDGVDGVDGVGCVGGLGVWPGTHLITQQSFATPLRKAGETNRSSETQSHSSEPGLKRANSAARRTLV